MSIHELNLLDRYQSEVQSQEHGFTLPAGYHFSTPSGNGVKQGTISVVDRYNVLYARLQYQNDKLNGVCEFERGGVVVESISYKNDVKDGWNIFYENKTEMKWVLFESGIIKRLLCRDPDLQTYRREYDVSTKELLFIAEYDKDNQVNGDGFTVENNKIVDYGQFIDGYMSKRYASFSNGVMTQYTPLGNIVYKGGFLNEIQLHFPRSGEGILYDDNKDILYQGNWENGIRTGHGSSYRNGTLVYEGLWKDDQPNGNGTVFSSEGEKMYEGDWNMGKLSINRQQYFDYSKFCVVNGTFVRSDVLVQRRSNYSFGEPTVMNTTSQNHPRSINRSLPQGNINHSAGYESPSPSNSTNGPNSIKRISFVKPVNRVVYQPSPPKPHVKQGLPLPSPSKPHVKQGPPLHSPPLIIIKETSSTEQQNVIKSPESPYSNGPNLNEKMVVKKPVSEGTIPLHIDEDSSNSIGPESKPSDRKGNHGLNEKEVISHSSSRKQTPSIIVHERHEESPMGSPRLPIPSSDPSSSTLESRTTTESTLQSETKHDRQTTTDDSSRDPQEVDGVYRGNLHQTFHVSPPDLSALGIKRPLIQVNLYPPGNNSESEKPDQKPDQKPEEKQEPKSEPEPEPEPEKPEDIAKRRRKLYMWLGCGFIAVVIFIIILLLPEPKVGKNGGDVTITSLDEWSRINHKVKTVTFNSDCCNEEEFEVMEFTDFPQLTTIKVGDYSLGKVRSLLISALPNLDSISVGVSSFASQRKTVVKIENRWFSLKDCPKLSSVSIDSYSFSDYKYLQVQNLPSLTTMTIGSRTGASNCFYYADLHLENLTALNDLHLGFGSFENSTHPILLGLPQLTEIHTVDSGVVTSIPNQLLSLLQLNLSIRNDVTKISIPDNQYNTIEELEISGFPFLETISIGNNCFKRVRKLLIYDLPSLVNITIGDLSFYPKVDTTWEDKDFAYPSEFHVYNCSSLESLILKRASFILYETLDFHNLPSLKTLEIGNPYTFSYNGVRAPLIVKDLPSLETLAIGSYTGMRTTLMQFDNLPRLQKLVMSEVDGEVGMMLIIRDCPSLRIVEAEATLFNQVYDVVIENIPNLEQLELRDDAFAKVETRVVRNASLFHTVPNLYKPLPLTEVTTLDPIIYGDNYNYNTELTCTEDVMTGMDALQERLRLVRFYRTKVMRRIRVFALMGMTPETLSLINDTMSVVASYPVSIDMYFYSDPYFNRVVDSTCAVPMIAFSQYFHPKRVVFHDGNFQREGFNQLLQWMVDNRNSSYFVNLEYLQVTNHHLARFTGDSGTALQTSIVANLQLICSDKVYFPQLKEINLNANSYSESSDGFDSALREACSESSGVEVYASDVEVSDPPMCNPQSSNTLPYFNMTDPKEVERCQYMWNWEHDGITRYQTIDPYPNDNTEPC